MKNPYFLTLFLSLWLMLQFSGGSCPKEPPSGQNLEADIAFKKVMLPNGVFYTLTVPPFHYDILPAASDGLAKLPDFVGQKQPLALINGGYFDPENGKTVSFLTLDGSKWFDPRDNERLTNNAGLKPYLEKVFDRSEFRRYRCGEAVRYDIVLHHEPIPGGCILEGALGAGPQLLSTDRSREEAFVDFNRQGKLIRDPLGVGRPNARSALGIKADGSVIFALGAQHAPANNGSEGAKGSAGSEIMRQNASGFTLKALSELLAAEGAVKVMALDGGSSSGLYYLGNYYYGKFDPQGRPVKRPVKSVLMVVPAVNTSIDAVEI